MTSRLPLFASDFQRIHTLFYLAGAALVVLILFTLLGDHSNSAAAGDAGQFSICFFRDLTHLPCPGCGMTRGMIALLSLDFFAALRFHPFSPFAMLALLFVIAAAFLKPLARIVHTLAGARIVLIALVFLLGFGLARGVFIIAAPERAHVYVYDFSRDSGPLDWPMFRFVQQP